jgi:hypothetical protein
MPDFYDPLNNNIDLSNQHNVTVPDTLSSKDYMLGSERAKGGSVSVTSSPNDFYPSTTNADIIDKYNKTLPDTQSNMVSPEGRSKDNIFKTSADTIFGLPPAAYYSMDYQSVILNSMPVLELTPGFPSFKGQGFTGLKLYKFDSNEGTTKFKQILNTLDIDLPTTMPMKYAFLYESPFTESFSNEYSESMFEEIANFKIPFLQEAKYISGKESTAGALDSLSGGFTGDGSVGKKLTELYKGNESNDPFTTRAFNLGNQLAGATLGGAAKFAGAAESALKSYGNYGSQVLKLLEGSNIDFPKIWQYSSYSPSYSVTIRLINPNPMDNISYMTYIIKPLVYLLSFVTPISDSESTFSFPLLCKVNCPGLFKIDSGYIQSLDVIKGGEGGDISFKQRPGTIDVRISFAEMYNTMISLDRKFIANSDKDRPTLLKYVDNLRNTAITPDLRTTNNVAQNLQSAPMQTSLTTISNRPSSNEENSPRVGAEYSEQYEKLKSFGAVNTEKNAPSEIKPLITEIDSKDVKFYEEIQANNDKNRLQNTINNEQNPSTSSKSDKYREDVAKNAEKFKKDLQTDTGDNAYKKWQENSKKTYNDWKNNKQIDNANYEPPQEYANEPVW